jgi:hypothetical protein
MFVFLVHSSQVGYSTIPEVFDQKLGVGEVLNKIFSSKSVDGDWGGFSVQSVVQFGRGSASGIITNDSETLGPGNLEFEVVGGTCGNADRSGIS